MENVYFSNWVAPMFGMIGLIFFVGVLFIFVVGSFFLPEFRAKWIYFLICLGFIGLFAVPPLFQVYFVRIEQNGSWTLKNFLHITLGHIESQEKREFTSGGKNLRGREVSNVSIHTDKKTYKTIGSVPETISAAIEKLSR